MTGNIAKMVILLTKKVTCVFALTFFCVFTKCDNLLVQVLNYVKSFKPGIADSKKFLLYI